MPIPAGGGSVLTQHQPHDTEMDGQCNTHDGSSGRPGALLEIEYFTDEFAVHSQYTIFHNIIFGFGEDNEYPGLIPCNTIPADSCKLLVLS